MNRSGQELLARLDGINSRLAVVRQSLATALQQCDMELTANKLRTAGYEMVSLAGALTTLGVDTARFADDPGQTDDGTE
jgi:hypothetical protein